MTAGPGAGHGPGRWGMLVVISLGIIALTLNWPSGSGVPAVLTKAPTDMPLACGYRGIAVGRQITSATFCLVCSAVAGGERIDDRHVA
jgi:hypothetical protein